MNFDLNEDQRMLAQTAASFAKKESPVARLRKLREDPIGYSRKVWRQMGEFGWLGVMFPEELGGLGGSFVDAAVVLEQLGTTLVPEPIIPALVAAEAIRRAGSPAQQKRWIEPLAGGEKVLAPAFVEEQGRHDPVDVTTRLAGGRLSGAKRWVLAGHDADEYVVSARTGGGQRERDGLALVMVPREAKGVTVTPVQTMDGRKAAFVRFDEVAVDDDRVLGSAGGAADAIDAAVDLGAAACCAEGVGLTQAMLWMTVEYLKTREQFGVKIGTFQALQHRAVDMFIEAELCRSAAMMSTIKIAQATDATERAHAVSAAKVQLATGGKYIAQQAIQLHGGIGITDEHDIGLYFKRMSVLNTLFGDEEHHLARFSHLPSFTAGV
jgi:alkylation response protein AidB-like acyl-CoA dehydrogenase